MYDRLPEPVKIMCDTEVKVVPLSRGHLRMLVGAVESSLARIALGLLGASPPPHPMEEGYDQGKDR